jgi:hypothetical protein
MSSPQIQCLVFGVIDKGGVSFGGGFNFNSADLQPFGLTCRSRFFPTHNLPLPMSFSLKLQFLGHHDSPTVRRAAEN